jgi:hypothetical protein
MSCKDDAMAYDEALASRIRELLGGEPGLVEKKMFGGLAMLLAGNMSCGVHGEDLIVRTDPTQQATLLAEPGARPFDMTARPMKGWILVASDGCAEDADLQRWVARGVAYARSLPPK